MAYNLIGKNFTPPDVVAKVTGEAKYAEDFRAEGMLFCRLLLYFILNVFIKKHLLLVGCVYYGCLRFNCL